jgi:hypothetical protein
MEEIFMVFNEQDLFPSWQKYCAAACKVGTGNHFLLQFT